MLNYVLVNYNDDPAFKSVRKGYNKDIKSIRINIDEFTAHHKPLIYYLVIGALHGSFALIMKYIWGFEHCTPSLSGLSSHYWHLAPLKSGRKDVAPIVFTHGIGAGIFGYASMLKGFMDARRRS